MDYNITFIIVTWNNQDTIIECLDSIYKYCEKFKVVIVDNNSDDLTKKMIKDRKYKNCKLIESKDNNGFAVGNNIALDVIDTEYICYLNPDTILIEDIIKPSLNVLKKNDEIGIVGCKLLYNDYKLQESTFNFETPIQIFFSNFRVGKIFPNFIRERYFPNLSKCKKNKYVDWIIGAEMILKTSDAKKILGFSTEYYMYMEDQDLCKKMETELNKRTYYLAETSLIHLGGVSESKNTNYNKLKRLIYNKVIFNNKFYGQKKAKAAIRTMKCSYFVRKQLVRILYYGKERKNLLLKMSSGYKFSKEAMEEFFR